MTWPLAHIFPSHPPFNFECIRQSWRPFKSNKEKKNIVLGRKSVTWSLPWQQQKWVFFLRAPFLFEIPWADIIKSKNGDVVFVHHQHQTLFLHPDVRPAILPFWLTAATAAPARKFFVWYMNLLSCHPFGWWKFPFLNGGASWGSQLSVRKRVFRVLSWFFSFVRPLQKKSSKHWSTCGTVQSCVVVFCFDLPEEICCDCPRLSSHLDRPQFSFKLSFLHLNPPSSSSCPFSPTAHQQQQQQLQDCHN